MSAQNPWEMQSEDASTGGDDAWQPHEGDVSRAGRAISQLRESLRGSRRLRSGLAVMIMALVVFAGAACMAGLRSASAAPQSVSAAGEAVSAATTESIQGPGMTGQILGIGSLCLDGRGGGVANGDPVILVTCNAIDGQQRWTLQNNKEIVANGHCLGVRPMNAKTVSLVGLYACNDAISEMWRVQNGHTILSVSSGLCLGSWKDKDTSGNLVWVTACLPTDKAQTWTVPSYAVDPSGLAMPVGDIPGWRQVFTDDFTKNVALGKFPAEVSSKWGDYLDGWPDTTHNGRYEPTQVVSIHNGIMNLYLHTAKGVHMVAAPYPKIPGTIGSPGGTLYGMYEVRFKAQQVKGYKTAWLLWPDSNNHQDGEIDFPEGNLQQNINAFLHHGNSNPKLQNAYPTPYTYAVWHTATTIWTADAVIFMLDGKLIGESTDKSIIPDKPMHWVLQTETRTGGGPPSDAATANVEIDWVSVWFPQKS